MKIFQRERKETIPDTFFNLPLSQESASVGRWQQQASKWHVFPQANVLFVSRHRGAVAWAATQGIRVDRQVMYLNPDDVQPGDTVIGSLPVHLAAAVCERGARYINLSLDIPRELRGKELSVDDMVHCHARLEEFQVRKADSTS